jgi:hypothetical protein
MWNLGVAIRYSGSSSAEYLTSNEVSNSEGDHTDQIRYAKIEGGLNDHKQDIIPNH